MELSVREDSATERTYFVDSVDFRFVDPQPPVIFDSDEVRPNLKLAEQLVFLGKAALLIVFLSTKGAVKVILTPEYVQIEVSSGFFDVIQKTELDREVMHYINDLFIDELNWVELTGVKLVSD